MSRMVFVLLVVSAVLATVLGQHWRKEKCGKNEEWTDCGTPCPLTCDDREPRICPAVCQPGCQCKPGFLRNRCKECVLPCDCD